jgi:hypothetical protein
MCPAEGPRHTRMLILRTLNSTCRRYGKYHTPYIDQAYFLSLRYSKKITLQPRLQHPGDAHSTSLVPRSGEKQMEKGVNQAASAYVPAG